MSEPTRIDALMIGPSRPDFRVALLRWPDGSYTAALEILSDGNTAPWRNCVQGEGASETLALEDLASELEYTAGQLLSVAYDRSKGQPI